MTIATREHATKKPSVAEGEAKKITHAPRLVDLVREQCWMENTRAYGHNYINFMNS